MFNAMMTSSDEVLMNQLHTFSQSTSYRGVEATMAEMWRRGITQVQYLEWLKTKMSKEKEKK